MDKFQDKYRIESSRLQKWDYGWNAIYFVTICTRYMECYFGKIVSYQSGANSQGQLRLQLSEIGKLASLLWMEIPLHFPFAQLGEFVIMPNHVHGIIVFQKNDDRNKLAKGHGDDTSGNDGIGGDELTPGQKRFRNQGKNTLSSVIGSYKSVVSKHAHLIDLNFEWQSRFYDHVVRDPESYDRIQNYIIHNPANWKDDLFYQ